MRKLLLAAVLAGGGLAGSAGTADAQYRHHRPHQPVVSSVTWPSANPPGWYTNTYKHQWFYPWYAYYDFSSGPYANWAAGGGYAGYTDHGPAGYYNYPLSGHTSGDVAPAAPAEHKDAPKTDPGTAAAEVAVTLPADAKLLFNGAPAAGAGAVRTFRTPELQKGVSYRYELTAEVTRDGRTERVTETVVVRAGETAQVTLAPTGIATAGAK
ncbi:TIGR03000 domain-containing protein [Gemmata sp. JC717]|uniref:TIGR03000 domain-containing protein n=1 Tax=Gemmata algarum TaxID=2975278 RepID=UPI0021BA922A|nr:TIGR03000 domain-containing protein [Gemmata algarum]MDY3552027.1 TIGR03000 domain-containing protein [Gemmata algarum]